MNIARGRTPRARRAPRRCAAAAAAGLSLGLGLAAPARAQEPFVFATTTDFSVAGSTARIGLAPPWPVQANLEPVSADPVARYFDGEIYVVNRFLADNIQVLDPDLGFDTVREFSVGAGTNPQDILVISPGKAYVTRYETHLLLIVNPSTGAHLGTINLAAFADADGIPEMSHMALENGRAFVLLQRLDRTFFTPVPPSYLAVINTTTDALVDANPGLPGVQAIPLTGTNPAQELQLDAAARRIYVSETGLFGELDGGVDVVDAAALAAVGFLTSEAQLGGDVGPFAVGASRGFAVVSNDFFASAELASFSLATGARTGTHYSTSGYVSDLELDAPSSQVFLCDRKPTAPGVRVFNAATGAQLTGGPLGTGLPPFDLVVARPATATVGGPPSGLLAFAAPNPFRESTRILLAAGGAEPAAGPGPAAVAIHDTRGRLVRTLVAASSGGGQVEVLWDGRDASGNRAAPGIYHFTAVGDGQRSRGRLVLVR